MPHISARLVALCLLMATTAGCGAGGDKDPLADDGAQASEVIGAWRAAVCDGNGEFTPEGSSVYGEVDGGSCLMDANGTLAERRQVIWVFDSPEAADTFVSTRNCAAYSYVSGAQWVSSVTYLDVATTLVKAGGTLCK